MRSESTHGSTGSPEKRVWRGPARTALLVIFGGFTAFFLGAALFGSQDPWLAGVIAVFFGVFTASEWRQGLYVEPTGVKLVLPGRLAPRRIEWSDIERFEMRLGAGQYPIALIRASDHQPIAVPTFPRLRKPPRPQHRVKLQSQVDELNALLAAHRVNAVADRSGGN